MEPITFSYEVKAIAMVYQDYGYVNLKLKIKLD